MSIHTDGEERPAKPPPEVDDDDSIPGDEDAEFMNPDEAAADDTVDDTEQDE